MPESFKLHPNAEDLTGMRFGMLLVVRPCVQRRADRLLRWECVCDCGRTSDVLPTCLKRGDAKSCGCRERMTHGLSKTLIYKVWENMVSRCHTPTDRNYHNYGRRGIGVCERWRGSFENFYADMSDRPTPKHELDRYPDNNGNYEPGNCRWATRKEQCRNTRRNVFIEFDGRRQLIDEWAQEIGLQPQTLRTRIHRGWPPERALHTPVQARRTQ